MTTGRIVLGRIATAFGVRGWVKVDSFTDPPDALMEHDTWTVMGPGGGTPQILRPLASRPHGKRFCVQIEGVEDRDAATALSGSEISVERAALGPTEATEYYRADLVGLAVKTGEGVELGRLSHFMEAPSGVMMVVRGEKERCVPAFAPYLRRVDLATGEIFVDWPLEL